MSAREADEPGIVRKAIRTATPPYWGRRDAEMDAFGWTMFLTIVILLVPLLPFVVIVWLVSKAFERADPRTSREG